SPTSASSVDPIPPRDRVPQCTCARYSGRCFGGSEFPGLNPERKVCNVANCLSITWSSRDEQYLEGFPQPDRAAGNGLPLRSDVGTLVDGKVCSSHNHDW